MFYLNKLKNTIIDSANNIVGFVVEKKFTQDDFLVDKSGKCVKIHPLYKDGLSGMELEKVSELMQREIR
jgi:hypothetical protein